MKLQQKYALSTFLLGTGFLVALTTVFYFQSRTAALDTARSLSETLVRENSADIEVMLHDEVNKALSLIYSPFIIEPVIASNDRYRQMSAEERTEYINRIEQQWHLRNPYAHMYYLRNQASLYLWELKRVFSEYYGELILTDRYGNLVGASNITSTFSQAGEPWWETAWQNATPRIVIDDRGFDTSAGDYVVGITVPVRTEGTSGEVIGLLKINLLLQNLVSQTLHTSQNQRDSNLLIARSGGVIMYDQRYAENRFNTTLGTVFSERPDLGSRGSFTSSDSDGRTLYTYEVIPVSTDTGSFGFLTASESPEPAQENSNEQWYVIHTQNLDTVFTGIRGTTITLVQIGMLFIFAMALLAVIAANSITHPVSRLIRYTRLIGQGSLDTVIPMDTNDEIGTLARAFNQMTLNLRQTMISRDHLASEIAQRQTTEAALRDSESRFHDLYNTMSSGVAIYEPTDDGQDFILKDMNSSGQRLSQIAIEDIRGKRITEVFPGAADIGLLDVLRRVNQTNEPEGLPLKHYQDERLTEWVENYVFKLNSGEIVAMYDDITDRKIAELQFERIFNLSLDLICIADFDGYFRQVNNAALTMLGYSEHELLEQPFFSFIHPDDIEMTEQIMEEKLRKGEPVIQFENRYRRKNGQYIWLSWVSHPVQAERCIYAIGRDITDQKKNEEEIRKLARFPEENTNPVLRIQNDGAIIYANNASRVLLEHWNSSVGGSVPDTIFFSIDKAFETGQAQSINTAIGELTYKLTLAPVTDAGFVNIYGMDITDRIEAEQALRESEEKFRLISEQSLMGIMILQDDQVLYANEAMSTILTLDFTVPENRTLQAVVSLVHPDDRELVQGQARKKQAGITEGVITDYTYRLITRDGRIKWIDLHSKTIMYSQKPADLLSCFDVTERKNIEQQMFQAQKMESVGRLAGGIAHDFNNLLTAIIGNVELATEDVDSESTAAEDLAEIKHTAERAAVLTRKLLAFSRRQITEPKIININAVITDMDKIFRRLISEHIELKTIPGEDLWNIRIDPGQLEQVIINLVVNARDAIQGTGTITIETQNVVLDASYLHDHPWAETGDFVMLAVSDTGVGMDETVQSQIFEPFFTTKAKEKGTGLGLSTCYGIIQQNDGSIGVYSEAGTGTTMKVYLPRRTDIPVEQSIAPVFTKETGGTETILVVEDEPSVRKMISRILTGRGYRVIEASNGKDALDILDKEPQSIDLLLTDVVMPHMGGRELSELLSSRLPDLETLFISGYTENAIVHNGELDKDISFLHKPFSPFALTSKVREVLDKQHLADADESS